MVFHIKIQGSVVKVDGIHIISLLEAQVMSKFDDIMISIIIDYDLCSSVDVCKS